MGGHTLFCRTIRAERPLHTFLSRDLMGVIAEVPLEQDSHGEFMGLRGWNDQVWTRPLPQDQLEVLQRGAEAARFFADLVGQGHGVARSQDWA